MSNQCKLCRTRGQTWVGDPPRCAFALDGKFSSDNWNCATMNELRELALPTQIWSNNESCGVVPFEDGFIVMTWYKRRGQTGNAIVMLNDNSVKPLDEETALEAITSVRQCKMCRTRGQTWVGDPPVCAFALGGKFSSDNWNCATMNELRKLALTVQIGNNNNENCGVVPFRNGFIMMTWHKRQGQTGNAIVMLNDNSTRPLDEETALEAIASVRRETAAT